MGAPDRGPVAETIAIMRGPNPGLTPTEPRAPSYFWFVTIAPQPANTSAKAARASAPARRHSGRVRSTDLLLCRGHQLVGELARPADGRHLSGHRLRVVLDALDRDPDTPVRLLQHGKRPARVAVLRLAHRPAVHEAHAAEVVHPRLVRVPEHQNLVALRPGQALVKRGRLLLEEVLVDLARRAVNQVHGDLAYPKVQVERQ